MAMRKIGIKVKKVKKVNQMNEKELKSLEFNMRNSKQENSQRYIHVKRRIDAFERILVIPV